MTPSVHAVELEDYDYRVAVDGTVFVHYQDNIYLVFEDNRTSLDGWSPEYDYYDVYILMDDGTMVNAGTMDEYAGQFTLQNVLIYRRTGPNGTYVYDPDYYVRCWLSWPDTGYWHTQQGIGGRVVFEVRQGSEIGASHPDSYYFVAYTYGPDGSQVTKDVVQLVVPTSAGATTGDAVVVPDGYHIELSTYGWTVTADNIADMYNSSNFVLSYWLVEDAPDIAGDVNDILNGTTATELPTGPAKELDDLGGQISDLTPTLPDWGDELPGDDSASNLFAYLYESTWLKQMFLTVSVVALCAFVLFGRRG